MLNVLFQQALAHSPELILFLVTSVLLPFGVQWLRANASIAQLKMIQAGADVAYEGVNAIARTTPSKVDDKAAMALDIFRKQLRMKISKADEPKFVAIVTAKHEAEKRGIATAPSGNPVGVNTKMPKDMADDSAARDRLKPR